MQYAFLVYAQIIRGVNEINSLAPRKRLETLRTKKSHYIKIPCEQALRGALAAGREKEGELATTSLEFEAAIHSTKFPEISVQNSVDRFGPTGKVSKKRVHLLRWTTFPGRTGWNFG